MVFNNLPQEQILATQITLMSFDAWRHSCGIRWQDNNRDGLPDKPVDYGGPNEVIIGFSEHFPSGLLEDYIPTRAVIRVGATREDYDEAYKTFRKLGDPRVVRWTNSWEEFERTVGRHSPLDWNIKQAREIGHYGVALCFNVKLGGRNRALNLKEVRENRWFDPVFGKYLEPRTFYPKTRGYRWHMPGVIIWHGVPRDQSGIDFTAEIKPDGFYDILPGTQVSGTATFRLIPEAEAEETATEAEEAATEAEETAVKARITLHHKIGNDKQSVRSIYAGTKKFKPGDVLDISFDVTAPTEDSLVIAEIQPVEVIDIMPANNIAKATISIARVDFTADIEPDNFYDVLPNTQVSGTATFKLTTGIPAEARINLYHEVGNDKRSIHTETKKFEPGKEFSIQFDVTASTVDSHIVAEIQPVEMTDLTPDNNIARATIFVEPPVVITIPPMDDIPLILTTEPERKPSRLGWTNARWTDRITAKIELPPPPPPITDWWISSATLYHPRAHPNATYGHYPPWMQRATMNLDARIPMPTGGRTSKVEFTQNWSIAGAPMYDMVTRQMVADAGTYPVKVEYTITYEYECEKGGTVRGEITGEAHGSVYVDGVGTVIIAN